MHLESHRKLRAQAAAPTTAQPRSLGFVTDSGTSWGPWLSLHPTLRSSCPVCLPLALQAPALSSRYPCKGEHPKPGLRKEGTRKPKCQASKYPQEDGGRAGQRGQVAAVEQEEGLDEDTEGPSWSRPTRRGTRRGSASSKSVEPGPKEAEDLHTAGVGEEALERYLPSQTRRETSQALENRWGERQRGPRPDPGLLLGTEEGAPGHRLVTPRPREQAAQQLWGGWEGLRPDGGGGSSGGTFVKTDHTGHSEWVPVVCVNCTPGHNQGMGRTHAEKNFRER